MFEKLKDIYKLSIKNETFNLISHRCESAV